MARQNVLVRTEEQLQLMRKSGWITAQALKKVIQSSKPGITLLELEKIATDEVKRFDGKSSFQTVSGYRYMTCLNLTDEVVHGLPRRIALKVGDILKIDLGALYKGWHTDAAWTVLVGETADPEKNKFLSVGEEAMWKAISQAVEGKQIGDISNAIQSTVEMAGYSVVKNLAGHGVGREAHEDPEIPEYGKPGTGMKLLPGQTIAIEAIYTSGKGDVYEKEDGWTLATVDGSWGGLFEMSMIVGKDKPEILTDWRKI